MKIHLAAVLLGLAAIGPACAATVLSGDGIAVAESSVERPSRGMTMAAVEARFGAPKEKHATVGKPPITRWDYANFAVFFEKERVIHAVAVN